MNEKASVLGADNQNRFHGETPALKTNPSENLTPVDAETSAPPSRTLAPRRWWLAGFLTVILPGLGQMYNGQPVRGLLFFGHFIWLQGILLHAILRPESGFSRIHFILSAIIIAILFVLFIVILADAIRRARRHPRIQATPFHRWPVFSAMILLSLSFHFLAQRRINEMALKTYRISSFSMLPTLRPGDHVISSRFVFLGQNPQRGEVVLFKNPGNHRQTFVKRIIGLPRETLEIQGQQVLINGEILFEPYLPDRQASDTLAFTYPSVRLKDGQYFVMGDNRKNSLDSRLFGPVDRSLIRGKPLVIFWSWDGTIPRSNWLKRWFSLRISRIGRQIQ